MIVVNEKCTTAACICDNIIHSSVFKSPNILLCHFTSLRDLTTVPMQCTTAALRFRDHNFTTGMLYKAITACRLGSQFHNRHAVIALLSRHFFSGCLMDTIFMKTNDATTNLSQPAFGLMDH